MREVNWLTHDDFWGFAHCNIQFDLIIDMQLEIEEATIIRDCLIIEDTTRRRINND